MLSGSPNDRLDEKRRRRRTLGHHLALLGGAPLQGTTRCLSLDHILSLTCRPRSGDSRDHAPVMSVLSCVWIYCFLPCTSASCLPEHFAIIRQCAPFASPRSSEDDNHDNNAQVGLGHEARRSYLCKTRFVNQFRLHLLEKHYDVLCDWIWPV